jgi:Transglycosylase SLT domain/SPOR domain
VLRAALGALAAAVLAVPALPAAARDGPQLGAEVIPLPEPRPAELTFDAPGLCALIADAAERHRLPPEFFARLIWKESRFDVRALSPAGAQGVAQFMPGTARLRGLRDPWDPREAIPASAHFLADLKARFGNLGLAAAAYNGGPHRVEAWLARGGGLPYETIDYVLSITSRPVEWFRETGREVEQRPLEKGLAFREACARLPVIATRAMAVATGDRKPWGVQIAAGISPGAALKAFGRARARAASVIGDRDAIVIRSRLVAGRTAYSARVGADSRAEAAQLCNRLRRIGAPCVVRRN